MFKIGKFGRTGAAASLFVVCATTQPVFAQSEYFQGDPDGPPQALAPLEQTSVSDFRALLYHTATANDILAIEAALVGTGLFGGLDIDTASMFGGVSVAELQQYDCVYVFSGFPNYSNTTRGNELGAYVDSGGGVVLAVAALARTNAGGYAITGDITAPTYSPLDANTLPHTAGTRTLNVATALLDHPILEGVSEISSNVHAGYSKVTLDPGAMIVGSDDTATPLIAMSAQGDVAALNINPAPGAKPSGGAYRAFANACAAVAAIHVDIDVKPDSVDNEINLRSHASVPVAIYGSDFIDVEEIDTSTLVFADGGVKMVGKKNKELCQIKDIDDDLYDDLICKFDAFDLGALEGASTEATLKGELYSGRKFRGSDSVSIIHE